MPVAGSNDSKVVFDKAQEQATQPSGDVNKIEEKKEEVKKEEKEAEKVNFFFIT